jgi:Insect pheromone-binding family, A10/OS-D
LPIALLTIIGKMQLLSLLFAALLVASVAAGPAGNNRKYNDKYDHIDVDAILRNDRILTSYVKCMLDNGPCTAEGKNLKGKFLFVFLKERLQRLKSFDPYLKNILDLTSDLLSSVRK